MNNLKIILFVLFIPILILNEGHTQNIYNFDYYGTTPPCNPFKDEPFNFSYAWKVSHGTPSLIDSYGQGFYKTLELTGTNNASEKTEGLYISYAFDPTHTYDIEILVNNPSTSNIGFELYATNGITEQSNTNCNEDNIPTVSTKDVIITRDNVFNSIIFESITINDWSPTTSYTQLWLLSREHYFGDNGTLHVSQVMIIDNTNSNEGGPLNCYTLDRRHTLKKDLTGKSYDKVRKTAYEYIEFKEGFRFQGTSGNPPFKAMICNNNNNRLANTENSSSLAKEETHSSDLVETIISPNPTNGKFNLEFSEQPENTQVQLTNLMGKVIFTKHVNSNNLTFDLSNNAKGVYLVKIITNGETRVEKVVYQ